MVENLKGTIKFYLTNSRVRRGCHMCGSTPAPATSTTPYCDAATHSPSLARHMHMQCSITYLLQLAVKTKLLKEVSSHEMLCVCWEGYTTAHET